MGQQQVMIGQQQGMMEQQQGMMGQQLNISWHQKGLVEQQNTVYGVVGMQEGMADLQQQGVRQYDGGR